jgi:hypothetical protein
MPWAPCCSQPRNFSVKQNEGPNDEHVLWRPAGEGDRVVVRAFAKTMPSVALRKRNGAIGDVALDDVEVGDTLVVFFMTSVRWMERWSRASIPKNMAVSRAGCDSAPAQLITSRSTPRMSANYSQMPSHMRRVMTPSSRGRGDSRTRLSHENSRRKAAVRRLQCFFALICGMHVKKSRKRQT